MEFTFSEKELKEASKKLDKPSKPSKSLDEIQKDWPRVRVLSLGAGVQSSTLALLFEMGKLENPPDFAVFADTQREPTAVYRYLDILTKRVKSFPIHVTTYGDLGADPSMMPWFLKHEDQKTMGMSQRRCTNYYKTHEVYRCIRKKLGYRPRQKTKHVVEIILGISTDEVGRRREARLNWQRHRYPLIDEINYSRKDCLNFYKQVGLPTPPRSACYFCPYRKNIDWQEMKTHHPKEFEKACLYDEFLRDPRRRGVSNYGHRNQYIHRSGIPLRKIDFNALVNRGKKKGEVDLMETECDTLMCGL